MSEPAPKDRRPERRPLFQPGDRLGNFLIRERIAWGGFGDLYRAHDLELQRRVAIKTIGIAGMIAAETASFLARFRLEATALAGIEQHENVVQVYQFGVTPEGVPFFVMPLLEGEDLSRRLKRVKSPLPVSEAVDIVIDACRGVYACHQAGLIHRDLKPGNLFLTTDARQRRRITKVLDFGIAMPKPSEGDGPERLTGTGIVLGTPGYMAPEQARAETIDERSDQYALGAILYTCLTQKRPHHHVLASGKDPAEARKLLAAAREELPILPPSTHAPVPYALEQVIMKALAPDPADRFASVFEFDSALKDFASPEAQRYHLDYYVSPPEPILRPQLSVALPSSKGLRPIEVSATVADRQRSASATLNEPPVTTRPIASPGARPEASDDPTREDVRVPGDLTEEWTPPSAVLRDLADRAGAADATQRPSRTPDPGFSVDDSARWRGDAIPQMRPALHAVPLPMLSHPEEDPAVPAPSPEASAGANVTGQDAAPARPSRIASLAIAAAISLGMPLAFLVFKHSWRHEIGPRAPREVIEWSVPVVTATPNPPVTDEAMAPATSVVPAHASAAPVAPAEPQPAPPMASHQHHHRHKPIAAHLDPHGIPIPSE